MGGLQHFLTVAGTNQDLALNVRENFKEDNGERESRADFDYSMHIIRQKFRKERKQYLEMTAQLENFPCSWQVLLAL